MLYPRYNLLVIYASHNNKIDTRSRVRVSYGQGSLLTFGLKTADGEVHHAVMSYLIIQGFDIGLTI